MSAKAHHAAKYRSLLPFLKSLREEATLTQRQLRQKMGKPQSWVYNCEVGNRRVDVAEFVLWCRACGLDAREAFERLLDEAF